MRIQMEKIHFASRPPSERNLTHGRSFSNIVMQDQAKSLNWVCFIKLLIFKALKYMPLFLYYILLHSCSNVLKFCYQCFFEQLVGNKNQSDSYKDACLITITFTSFRKPDGFRNLSRISDKKSSLEYLALKPF